MILTSSQLGDLRVAILDELVTAKAVAFNPETIMRRVLRAKVLDFEFSQAQLEHELDALISLELAKAVPDAVTRQTHYQATAKGIVARS